jgi:hypothetical protein
MCTKCGAENLENAKFCNNCGVVLKIARKVGFEDLITLHMLAAFYSLLSAAFNSLIQATSLLWELYLATGALGIYCAYALNAGIIKRWTKFVSLTMIVVGLAGTTLMFLIGLGMRRVVDPGWIIFLVIGWKLWQNRYSL